MDQDREDYADPESATRPLASNGAHAALGVAGGLYPFGCVLLLGCTRRWFPGAAPDQLLFHVFVVPVLAVGGVVLLRASGVRLCWAVVTLFAVWACLVGLFIGLIMNIHAST